MLAFALSLFLPPFAIVGLRSCLRFLPFPGWLLLDESTVRSAAVFFRVSPAPAPTTSRPNAFFVAVVYV